MTTYAAFLRGVNLGPTRKIAMPELRALAEGLGHTEVWTYINSGNLVFASDLNIDDVRAGLEAGLATAFGQPVDVAVRNAAQLRSLVAANPFPDDHPSRVTVAFLTGPAPEGVEERLDRVATAAEPYVVAGREIWVHYGDGIGESKLARGFSKIIGVSATVRNAATLTKITAKLPAP